MRKEKKVCVFFDEEAKSKFVSKFNSGNKKEIKNKLERQKKERKKEKKARRIDRNKKRLENMQNCN